MRAKAQMMTTQQNKPDDNSDSGDALWDAVASSVVPLKDKGLDQPKTKVKPFILLENKLAVTVKKPVHDVNLKPHSHEELSAGDIHFMDKNTGERFRKGKMPIDARLDLHGFFVETAFERLRDFIYSQSKKGARCVLIVTGKGLEGKSIIRAELPAWLNHPDIRSLVVSFTTAVAQDGGGGAFYVLLKRNREG